jgi:hypothetical protein
MDALLQAAIMVQEMSTAFFGKSFQLRNLAGPPSDIKKDLAA